ncbi:MAG: tetratricopeptide repeat protein [Myxococcota bacterium]
MRVQGPRSTPWVHAIRRALAEAPSPKRTDVAWNEAPGVDLLRLPRPPGPPDARLSRAHGRATDGDLRGAMELYREAIAEGRHGAHPWLGSGAVALASGDLNAARQAFRSYVQQAPTDPRGWANLAETELRRDELSGADQALAAAEALPADPSLARRIQALHRALTRRKS